MNVVSCVRMEKQYGQDYLKDKNIRDYSFKELCKKRVECKKRPDIYNDKVKSEVSRIRQGSRISTTSERHCISISGAY